MIPAPHQARHGPPLAALLFRPGPGLAPEAHRVAHGLLEDAARNRGGRVSAAGQGAWRLEAAPPALEMARRALSAVLNGRDAALLTEAPATPPAAAASASGPEAILRALPLEGLLDRRPILGFGAGGSPRPAGLRILPSAPAIAAALGPRWAGAPWQEHAGNLVARRAMGLAPPPEGPLHLDLPPEVLPDLGAAPVLPILPLRALARPPAAPFGIDGSSVAALALLDPAQLPGAVLHLTLEPGLDALPTGLWPLLNPARVVLGGVADVAGLEWGLARGIGRFTGPWPDRLLASLWRRADGRAG